MPAIETEYERYLEMKIPFLREWIEKDRQGSCPESGFFSKGLNLKPRKSSKKMSKPGEFIKSLGIEFSESDSDRHLYQEITFLLRLLMEDDEFADVREGIIGRLFYYVKGMHLSMNNFLIRFYKEDPDLFKKVFPLMVSKVYPDNPDSTGEFEFNTAFLILYFLAEINSAELSEFIKTIPFETAVRLFSHTKAGLSDRYDFEKKKIIEALNTRSDAEEISEYAEYREKKIPFLRQWIQQIGRKDIKNMDFYKGGVHESGELIMLTTKGELVKALGIDFDAFVSRGELYKEITFLLRLLMEEDEFRDVREGIIGRMFHYVSQIHLSMNNFLEHFYVNNPDLFMKVFPFMVSRVYPDIEDCVFVFEYNNSFLILRFLSALDNTNLEDLINQIPPETAARLVNHTKVGDSYNKEKRRVLEAIKKRFDAEEIFAAEIEEETDQEIDAKEPEIEEIESRKPKIETEYEKFRKQKTLFLRNWIDSIGRENVVSTLFYKEGPGCESFEMMDHTDKVGALYNSLEIFTSKIEGKISFPHYKLTYLLRLLIEEEEFIDVREGIIGRLFYYAGGMHISLNAFLNILYHSNRELFMEAFPFMVPKVYVGHKESVSDFNMYNDFLMLRFLGELETDELNVLINAIPSETAIRLISHIRADTQPKYRREMKLVTDALKTRPDAEEIFAAKIEDDSDRETELTQPEIGEIVPDEPEIGEIRGEIAETVSKKSVYLFSDAQDLESDERLDVFGAYGAEMAGFANMGIPVAPGFVISRGTVEFYDQNKRFPEAFEKELKASVRSLEEASGKTFGGAENPLLLNVQSGNENLDRIPYEHIGLSPETVEGYGRYIGDIEKAYKMYIDHLSMLVKSFFDESRSDEIKDIYKNAELGESATLDKLKDLAKDAEELFRDITGRRVPTAEDQLMLAIEMFISENEFKIMQKGVFSILVNQYVTGTIDDGKSLAGIVSSRDVVTGMPGLFGVAEHKGNINSIRHKYFGSVQSSKLKWWCNAKSIETSMD